MDARFEVVEGPMKGRTFPINPGETTSFGRGEQADHVLQDEPAASRLHFSVRFDPPRARLKDLGSVNGVRVNDRRVGGLGSGGSTMIELLHGDSLRIGKTVLVFRCPGLAENSRNPSDTINEQDEYAAASAPVPSAPVPSAVTEALFAHLRSIEAAAGAPAAEASSPPEVPGFHQLEIQGGNGGGSIYRARRADNDRPVILKIARPVTEDPERERRLFLREMELTCAVRHPNVVEFLGAGNLDGGRWYLALEYMAGGDLAARLAGMRGGMRPAEAVDMARQLLEGLATAHAAGVVHRNIHPGNVFFADASGRVVKLGGLGMAKEIDAHASRSTLGAVADGGSWRYMAPEQLLSFSSPMPASDLFSLAATVYEALSREGVYRVEGGDLYQAMLEKSIEPLSRRMPELDRRLAAAIDRALSPEPEDRYADAIEFLRALRALPPL